MNEIPKKVQSQQPRRNRPPIGGLGENPPSLGSQQIHSLTTLTVACYSTRSPSASTAEQYRIAKIETRDIPATKQL
ncbi:hypothetical protein NIES4101_50300 [Calothrix sp. NIES-4101]|nr:hypothetical protein NIES4101_50300 [Calothrix sp. NIES-4101]